MSCTQVRLWCQKRFFFFFFFFLDGWPIKEKIGGEWSGVARASPHTRHAYLHDIESLRNPAPRCEPHTETHRRR